MLAAEPEHNAHRRGGQRLIYMGLALMGYVLSTGPVIALADHGYLPQAVLSMYDPLQWIAARYLPGFYAILIDYVNWWERRW